MPVQYGGPLQQPPMPKGRQIGTPMQRMGTPMQQMGMPMQMPGVPKSHVDTPSKASGTKPKGIALQPTQQQQIQPIEQATLVHMLRMTGELRQENTMGLRTVLRPPMAAPATGSKASAPTGETALAPEEVPLETIADSPGQVPVRSSTSSST